MSTSSLLIDAPPKVVWEALKEERNSSPDVAYSKMLQSSGNTEVLEQKFKNLPVIGSATAVTHHVKIPFQRIDYKLVRSDKFKALEGSWELTPAANGKQTVLKLSSRIDVGVPFSGVFIKSATNKKIKTRLTNVKKIAEATQRQLAAEGREL